MNTPHDRCRACAWCFSVLFLVGLCACGTKQRVPSAKSSGVAATGPGYAPRPIGTAVRIDDPSLAPEFNNLAIDGTTYFAGWPTEAGLRALAARGVKTVITLKTPDQVLAARGYDPRKVAAELGLTLVVIPVAPDTYSVADIDAFAAAFDHADGPVLIHCGASATVGGVWSGYLVAKRGLSTTDALARGRAAGLKDGPMTDATERVFGEIEASSKPVLVPSAPVQ